MSDKRQYAAAIAAVIAFLRQEEELLAAQGPLASEAPLAAAASAGPPRLWGFSGRQSQMQLRQSMQLRAFHGTRLR